MAAQMAQTPQPHVLSSWITAFEGFDRAHGFAVNLFVVIALALLGLALLAGRTRVLPYAVAACAVLCLATWVLVQDLGFFGGVGTDPNSMIPVLLVIGGGYLGMTRVPAVNRSAAAVTRIGTWQRPKERLVAWWSAVGRRPAYLLHSVIALGAVGILLLGAAPMAVASLQPHAAPILAEAVDGAPNATNFVARDFRLADQYGRPVSLASLRGKTVALTFLDPVCTSDCPLIGQYFRQADAMLAPSLRQHVELVAIVANPLYRSRSYLLAYDQEEGMQHLANWLYLTGPLQALRETWDKYGVQVEYEPAGAMIGHSEIAYVIGPRGHVRSVLESDPGSGTEAQESSLAVTLAAAIRSAAR
jgi:cytochrome oxidase Cu insertion factor (SCO1/SenC/PrrC family)